VAPGPVIQHDGPVMQLSGKGLLVPGSWKRRYCVLDGRRLYYYQLNGVNIFSQKKYKETGGCWSSSLLQHLDELSIMKLKKKKKINFERR
jgi:hypothetical protein